MKVNRVLVLVAVSCLLGSCATQYKKQRFLGGGYSDFRVADNKFVVSFRGNEYTSSDKAMRFALLRAAVMAHDHGYTHFVVTEKEDLTKSKLIYKTEESEDSSNSKIKTKEVTEQEKPGIRLYITCFRDKPDRLDAIEAKGYILYNKP